MPDAVDDTRRDFSPANVASRSMINLRIDRFGLQLQRVIEVRFDSKNRQIRRREPQLFLISSLAMESNPFGMVKSSASGLLFFSDCGH